MCRKRKWRPEQGSWTRQRNRKGMLINRKEIKENEKVSEETDYALTEYDRVEREVNISAETEEGEEGEL